MADANANAIQAIAALSKAAEVTAENLANVSTPGFKARRVRLADGPGGEGVRVAQVAQDPSPGPDISAVFADTPPSGWAVREGSNVDIAQEMVDLISTQNAFAANVAVAREWDRTLGLVLDLKA
ncbi:MAG: flagellar basal body rod C-terminal domain-containing protein [Desulfovibrio sp.]